MFAIDYDERLGVLRVTLGGFFKPDELREQSARGERFIARARREFGDLKALVIKQDNIVQSAETIGAAAETIFQLSGPYDKTAVVCSSALARMQNERLFDREKGQVFATEKEAIAWLLADRDATARVA